MDVLDRLSEDQKELVVSLPYRAGLWVSQSDVTGGAEAEEKERTALSNIIDGFSHQVFGSELLQYIMNETVKRKDQWADWAKKAETVPADCEKALDILREHVDEKDVNAYCIRLMEIAEAVALAFREYQNPSMLDQLTAYFSYIVTKIRARLRKQPSKSFDQYLNISQAERKALGALANALGTNYSI